MFNQKVVRVSSGCALVFAALLAGTAPAEAEDPTFDLPRMSTGADGFACAGDVSGQIITHPNHQGWVDIRLRGSLKAFGIPAPWCQLAATVEWRNLDTGKSGSVQIPMYAEGNSVYFWAIPLFSDRVGGGYAISGSGEVEFTLNTNYPHTPSATNVTVS
ncbi:hypothetical protein ACIBG0_41605 [Nocardia sp. NPDC050630]|uniref:hypothetical protein n=1 Tax=Nocardia sp. NPDC050630 TaxID=3364321 RepID=UPI00378997AA